MATSVAMDHSSAQQDSSVARSSVVDSSVADSVTELTSDQAHDRKRPKMELVCAIDAARHDSIGADSVKFTDGVLSQSAFLQRLSARDILNLKGVCKSWATWYPANITAITDAHRLDNNRDWFFPLIAEPDLRTPTSSSFSLSGIRHETAHQSSGKLMSASPILDYLPPPPRNCRLLRYDIIASSDGLLLVKALSVSLKAPHHTQRQLEGNACYRCRDFRLGRRWDWESLTMINPLTKQFRVLPAFEGQSLKGWTTEHSHGEQAQIMVDADANSYKVLYYEFTSRWLYVYESKSDIWRRVQYHSHTRLPQVGDYCTSATLRGRLYFADIRGATGVAEWIQNWSRLGGVLRLFEIDIGTGHWIAFKDFPLCKWPDSTSQDSGYFDHIQKNVLRNLELVECMGHLFAVIPERLGENVHPSHNMQSRLLQRGTSAVDLEYIMALQFYIFQLEGEEGENLHCGVLRIELPRSSMTCKDKRQVSLYVKTSGAREPAGILDPGPNWFSCTARGSVIWVSCEDYLLQYDVDSGQSKTQLLPKHRMHWMQRRDHQLRLAYRPSFHMKP